MELFRFPIRNDFGCDHVPLERIIFLEANGNYTNVTVKDEKGVVASHLQSGHLKKFSLLLEHGFVKLRRNLIVNRSHVTSHTRERNVILSTGQVFRFSKKMWPRVKRLLNNQLLIPFTKKGDSLNGKGDSLPE
jgi:DNA-binding LytR/AlgR family response regulator